MSNYFDQVVIISNVATTAASAAGTYFQNEMLFASLLILLARSHRPPALAAFILEQVERRHFAVGSHHLQRAFLLVLCRFRNTIQVQRDRSCETAREANEYTARHVHVHVRSKCHHNFLSYFQATHCSLSDALTDCPSYILKQ